MTTRSFSKLILKSSLFFPTVLTQPLILTICHYTCTKASKTKINDTTSHHLPITPIKKLQACALL